MANESEDLSPAELDAATPAVDNLSELPIELQQEAVQSGMVVPPVEQAIQDVQMLQNNNVATEPLNMAAAELTSPQQQALSAYLSGKPKAKILPPDDPYAVKLAQEEQQRQQLSNVLQQSAPTVPSPAPINDALPQQVVQEMTVATTPTEIEAMESIRRHFAPVRRKIADSEAKKLAEEETANYLEQEKVRQQAIQNEMSAMDKRDAEYVRAGSFGEIMRNGSFGNKILAGLAVALGGLSQGLTGAAKNPVLELLDAEADRQAQKDKLTAEQKLQLRAQLLDSAKNVVAAANNRYQNQNTQDRLQLEYDKIAGAFDQTMQRMAASYKNTASTTYLANVQSSTGIPIQGTPQERAQIARHNQQIDQALANLAASGDDKQYKHFSERVVVFPNGKKDIVPTGADGGLKEWKTARSDNEAALQMFNTIDDLMKNGGKYDPKRRAMIESTLITLTGRLREAVVGPGAMTPAEYERLREAVGDPKKLTSLDFLGEARMNAMRAILEGDLVIKTRNLINKEWTPSQRAQVYMKFRQSGMDPASAGDAATRFFLGRP